MGVYHPCRYTINEEQLRKEEYHKVKGDEDVTRLSARACESWPKPNQASVII